MIASYIDHYGAKITFILSQIKNNGLKESLDKIQKSEFILDKTAKFKNSSNYTKKYIIMNLIYN